MRRIFMTFYQTCLDQNGPVICACPLDKAFALRYAGKYTKICTVLHDVSSASLPGRCLMAANNHETYIYVGLAGEGQYMAEGGLYRYTESTGEWQSLTKGLPPTPQVRALLIHPDNPAVLYAGTQCGPYRSNDRGEHWHKMHTDKVIFPHITTYMHPICKRVIGITADPSNPSDMYAAIEVGGLLGSRDGGESWTSLLDGPYVRNNTLDLHGVQVSAAAPGTVYIITQVAMFRGRDRGQHWEHIQIDEMFPGGSYCRGLLVAPNDPKSLYMAAGAGGGGAP